MEPNVRYEYRFLAAKKDAKANGVGVWATDRCPEPEATTPEATPLSIPQVATTPEATTPETAAPQPTRPQQTTPEATTLINRCDEDQTYEARLAAGTLPKR